MTGLDCPITTSPRRWIFGPRPVSRQLEKIVSGLYVDIPRLDGDVVVVYTTETVRDNSNELGTAGVWRGKNGGWYRDRTCDPYHVKVVLYR
jgi:hypothetical protein